MKGFLSVAKDVKNEIIIEKSRFITTLKRVSGEDEAKAFVSEIKQTYPDATHNCYAYIADEGGFYVKFSDDGEPQGTAGLPMLEMLKARGLKKVAAVVTRYFGGVKLGTGGLVRAYADCVKKAIDLAGVSKSLFSLTFKVEISYSLYPKLLNILASHGAVKLNDEYLNDGVLVTFIIPEDNADKISKDILDTSCGKAVTVEIERGFYEYGA